MGFLRRLGIRIFGRSRIDGGSVELSREFAAMLEGGGCPARICGGEDSDGLAFMIVEDVYGTPLAAISGRPLRRGYLVSAAPLQDGHEAWFFARPGRGDLEAPGVLDETLSILAGAGLIQECPSAPPGEPEIYSAR